MEQKIAVAYARFSSEKQNHTSIEVQLEKIEEFCQRNNLLLIEKYIDEAQSGTNDKRKDFQRMMRDSEKGLFQYIVVHRNDRWARNTEDAMYYSKILNQKGIKILSVIENFDSKTPEGGFFNLVSMGMAELYSKKMARESWEGLIKSAKQGKVIGGNPPFGYRIDGRGKNKKYVIEESEAKVVREMFNLVAEGKSYAEAYRILKDKGFKDMAGFSITSLHDKLRNPRYKGEYVFNRFSTNPTTKARMRYNVKNESEIIRIPNGYPKIVEPEIFDKVQKILDKRKGCRVKKQDTSFLLTSFAKCECGYSVVGSVSIGVERGVLRHLYECCSKKVPKCEVSAINMKVLDGYIFALMKNVFLKVENAIWLKQLIQDSIKSKIEYNNIQVLNNLNKIEEILTIIKGLEKSKLDNQFNSTSLEFIEEEIMSLKSERMELLKLNKILKDDNDKLSQKVYIEQIRRKIRELKSIFFTSKLSEQRKVLRKILHQLILCKDHITTQINLWCFVEEDYSNEFADDLIINIYQPREEMTMRTFKPNSIQPETINSEISKT